MIIIVYLFLPLSSEVWLVPHKTGGYIPATFSDPKAEVVRALNRATSGAPQGKSLKVYASDLSCVEIEKNVCKIWFALSRKGMILESLLGWSGCRRSVMLGCECRLQPAVLPALEELVKVRVND